MRKRQVTKKKTPHKVFLVICEGETEKTYIETLKRHYRLPIVIKTRVSGTKINQRLVSQYIAELGIDKGDQCHVFFVYDADVDEIVEKLKQLNGTLILSNPCIELWYLLHVKEYRKSQGSAEIVKELINVNNLWSNYIKGRLSNEQSSYLLSNCQNAILNAHKLTCHNNPSSNMYLMIEAIEKEQNC